MKSFQEEYLDLIRGDSSLCLPYLDLDEIARRLDIPLDTLRSRRSYRDDMRKEERKIIATHIAKAKVAALSFRSEEEGEGEPDVDELPPTLERYLELYRELDDRLAAVKQLQGEGVALDLDDILQAMQEYPAFDRAMRRLWVEGNIESEDQLRRKAREGKQAPLAMYLKGNLPEKYGNKAKIDVTVTHQLGDEDRHLVETVKRDYIAPPRRRLRTPVEIGGMDDAEEVAGDKREDSNPKRGVEEAHDSSGEDVVEGEVVPVDWSEVPS